MIKTIVIFLAAASLLACAETWEGVKKDTKTITQSVGDAGNELSKKIGEALNDDSDSDKESEE